MYTIDWNAVTAISTVALVFFTASYVYLTRKTLQSVQATYQEQFRPEVYAFFVSKNGYLHLMLGNYGKRPAINSKVEFNPPLDEKLFHEKLKDTKRLLIQTVLMPSQSIESVIAINRELFNHPNFKEITFQYDIFISYNDPDGVEYNTKYLLNIEDFYFKGKTAFYEQKYYVQRIYEQLKGIKEIIKNRE